MHGVHRLRSGHSHKHHSTSFTNNQGAPISKIPSIRHGCPTFGHCDMKSRFANVLTIFKTILGHMWPLSQDPGTKVWPLLTTPHLETFPQVFCQPGGTMWLPDKAKCRTHACCFWRLSYRCPRQGEPCSVCVCVCNKEMER